MTRTFTYLKHLPLPQLHLSYPSLNIIMRSSHPDHFLWLSCDSSKFPSNVSCREKHTPGSLEELNTASHYSASLPHIVLTLLAASSFWRFLSWSESTKSPEYSFMNSYQVAFFHLDLMQWISFFYQPKYRFLHLSQLHFSILISILFHSLSRPF